MDQLISWMQGIDPALGALTGIPLGVFLIVAVLTALFVLSYTLQGLRIGFQLWSINRKIARLRAAGQAVDPAKITPIMRWEPLKHLWEEYADTLHLVRKAAGGGGVLTEVRATLPAETFFTREVLVDSRLFDDFTRHLPGVLTGLGIIGTFAGLLEGLKNFDPSTTTTAVAGLTPLMEGVRHAFVASAIAIACAMGVIFISRFVLAGFYRMVEKLNHGIDALYATGAGEEYLSRLVQASENSEAHTAQLKDSLVQDLRELMTNLVDRQIQAQAAVSTALGENLTGAISTSLAQPLERMTEVMEQTSRGHGEAVSGMLETLLTAFMAKLEDTFGGQMRGINEQMQRSMQAMETVQQSMQRLLGDVAATQREATTQMTDKLAEAMQRSADNQTALTEQMREFVQQFRTIVAEEQGRSRQAMDEAMNEVLGKVSAAVQHLEEVRRSAAQDEAARGQRLTDEAKQLVGGLSGQVDELLKAVAEQVQQTQRNVDRLGEVSLRAIEGMNDGAATMSGAAQRFETAGASVTSVFERSASLSEQLNATAGVLQSAASAARQGIDQYEATRRTVEGQVGALTTLVETARKEAGMTKEVAHDLERIVAQLKLAENESQQYLEKVNAALAEAFAQFGNAMSSQLTKTIAESDAHLGRGVSHLTGVVQELAMALARMKKS